MQATTTAANLVLDVLDEFIKAGKLFTAYDVTKEVRNRTQENIRHDSVNDLVYSLYMAETTPFDKDDYIREAHSFLNSSGILTSAQVYRPVGVDVNTYQPNDIKQTGVALVPSVAKNIPKAILGNIPVQAPLKLQPLNIKTTTLTLPVRIDQRGRLCIPNKLVRAAGFKSGNTVRVFSTGSPVGMAIGDSLTGAIPAAYEELAAYTVDKDCNVRVMGWVVSACGLNNIPSSARIDSGRILVE